MLSLTDLTATKNKPIFFILFMSSELAVSMTCFSVNFMSQILICLSEDTVTKCYSDIQSSPKILPL